MQHVMDNNLVTVISCRNCHQRSENRVSMKSTIPERSKSFWHRLFGPASLVSCHFFFLRFWPSTSLTMEVTIIQNAFMLFLEKRYMITIGLLIIIFTIFLIYLYHFYSDIPPGPWGLPFFGYSLFLSKEPHKDFIKLGKKYGDVFSIGIGPNCCIILNSYKSIKDGLTKGEFDGRAKDGFTVDFGEDKTVILTDGEIWRSQRRFLLSALKDYGLDKSQLEQDIHKLAKNAINLLLDAKGQPIGLYALTSNISANVMCRFMLGHQFSNENQSVLHALNTIEKIANAFSFVSPANAFAGIMRYLPQKWTGIDALYNARQILYNYVEKFAKEHDKTFNEYHLRDLIDVYLMKLKATSQHGQEASEIFTMPYIRSNVATLFIAGSETTASLLTWSFKILAAHPKVQKRMQSEIEDVVGCDRHPTMGDLSRMPYTEAVMLEIQRYASITPISPIVHRITDDVVLNGYRIPKNSLAVANFWSVHYDPEIWKNPEVFDPERFLDENGVIGRLREFVMTFSVGKRRCLGESLARIEYFLVLTTMLQELTFFLPQGDTWPLAVKIDVPVKQCKNDEICAVKKIH